jgi:ribosomal protein S12 methylthiotransferase
MARFAEIVAAVREGSADKVDVQPPHHRWADVGTRARTGYPWSAYLKISEGCDHRCTFCTIPSFRGNHQSKPIERVVAEARQLAATGTLEINLIAQDVTQYGFDLYKEFTLPKLLRELNQVEGIRWIRLLYFYPNRLTDEVIEAMATCEKVLPYIDIPLQHAHPDTLRRMKRPWEGERYLKLFEKLRAALPTCAIRTTYIVGFPGETEEEFQYLIDFTKDARLDRVGAFKYSREPGTPSHDMENQISLKVKNERYEKVMRVQQSISHEINRAWIGKPIDVLVDRHHDGWSIGRSFRDAPEIDGHVLIAGELPLGSISTAMVTSAEPYDLQAEPIGPRSVSPRTLQPLRMAAPSAPK